MYIIDYKKELVKNFTNKEMASFLNHEVIKSRYIVAADYKEAKKVCRFIAQIPNKTKSRITSRRWNHLLWPCCRTERNCYRRSMF